MRHSQQKSELIMKNYEVNNQANKIQANLSIEKKNFMDFYKEVKNGKIVPVTDEQDNIIGFNVIKNEPSMMKVCKMIDGYMTVGDTEEQRSEDEVNLRKFIKEYPIEYLQTWFMTCMVLVKSNIEPDDIIDTNDEIYIILADAKKVIDMNGNTIVDLSNDEDLKDASKNIIIKLLKSALNIKF